MTAAIHHAESGAIHHTGSGAIRHAESDAIRHAESDAIRHADSDDDIAACFPVMQALRPHLTDAADLLRRVRRQQAQGYRLLAAWQGAEAIGAAGYRLQENLIRGPFCYIDDLVVAPTHRRHGLGARLLDACADQARAAGIGRLTLDTGLDNLLGQRFYFRYGMLPSSLRFALTLD